MHCNLLDPVVDIGVDIPELTAGSIISKRFRHVRALDICTVQYTTVHHEQEKSRQQDGWEARFLDGLPPSIIGIDCRVRSVAGIDSSSIPTIDYRDRLSDLGIDVMCWSH